MIDEIFLDADVPGEHVRDEAIGEGAFRAQQADHRSLLDDEDVAWRDRRGGRHPQRLSGQVSLAEEVSRADDGENSLFAGW
jgi:hypothetical protein